MIRDRERPFSDPKLGDWHTDRVVMIAFTSYFPNAARSASTFRR
jgi:vacuolar-type H+-ATPase catalytic subunit A/Vma1